MVKAMNRRVQILRAGTVTTGLSTKTGPLAPYGPPQRAAREDVGSDEKAQAATVYGEVSARFTLRSTEFTRTITAKDSLREGGRVFRIIGMRELGRNAFLEFTASARTDL